MKDPFFIDEVNGIGVIIADKSFFSNKAVMFTAEDYSKKYFVSVNPEGNAVKFTLKSRGENTVTELCLKEVMNTLIDYQIRVERSVST